MRLLQRIPYQPGSGFRPFMDEEIEQSIPQRFEQQVRAFGDHLAIRWPRGSYTFSSLNETANRLARTLDAARGKPAEPVALLFDHGGEILAAIFAVLKAGKFYVVLDPAYPPDRLKYILEDSGAKVVVAGANHIEHARQLCASAIELVDFDAVDPGLSGADLGAYPAPESLAMILYTSGSTGRPKGVMHSHRNVLVDVRNLTNGWSVTARDRWLLYTSMGFANSVRTIYSSLLNGAAVFPFDIKKQGFRELTAWLLDNDITIIRAVSTFFRAFMASVDENLTFPAVRLLSVGAEPMLQADLGYVNRHFSSRCVLSHAFGPTECLTVCWALVPHGTPVAEGKLPIGYTLQDKDVRLLDESRREVSDGEVGEIAVTSRYISRGYWRDPERTRAAFLPDPSGSDACTYLTGDLGVRAPDGRLIHVGRRDFQVKIRGYRIDVSEIENALRALPGIGDAVVVGRELDPGVQALVGYFVASPGPRMSQGKIRQHLGKALPDYMIPSVLVAMDAIPRTPNGKADRLRLPLPARGRRDVDAPFTAPCTAIESELAAIWAKVLGLQRVGTEDHFLELGGESLQAQEIVYRVAARFGLEMSTDILFEAGTIAEMAKAVAAADSSVSTGRATR
jgi:amino acid adenylation domain-containing protein